MKASEIRVGGQYAIKRYGSDRSPGKATVKAVEPGNVRFVCEDDPRRAERVGPTRYVVAEWSEYQRQEREQAAALRERERRRQDALARNRAAFARLVPALDRLGLGELVSHYDRVYASGDNRYGYFEKTFDLRTEGIEKLAAVLEQAALDVHPFEGGQ